MHTPDDFDLSPAATLAHVADLSHAPWHVPFWNAWQHEFWVHEPRLTTTTGVASRGSDPGVTHQFDSFRSTRIGCRLLAPAGTPRAGVVVLHGYGDVPSMAKDEMEWSATVKRGIAVLLVRVRGFPGSQLDAGPLCEHPMGYVTAGLEGLMHGPEDALRWVLPGAVADVANACRVMRSWLNSVGGAAAPLMIRGESFGAGLAVIAAAQLGPRLDVQRLILGVPTLGDWGWRLSLPDRRVPRAGMNREIRELMIREGRRAEEIAGVLRLCDAAIHAKAVKSEAVCKLALRDDVVPAPTQAAVFNALAAPRGLKVRMLVRYGHFDGGLANARRHAEFESVASRYVDPSADILDFESTRGVN